jgi:hypothetical protein
VAAYLEVLTDKINKHEARIGKNSVDNADQDEKLGGVVTSISDFRTSIASLQDQVAFFHFLFSYTTKSQNLLFLFSSPGTETTCHI